MGYIYKIRNKIDNKTYIGQTTQDLDLRWKQHLRNRSNCRYLKHGFDKHGIDNFEFKLVCITFDDLLNDMEIKYIQHFKCLVPNGYNLRLGGNSGKHNEETKRKISEALKNGYKNGTIARSRLAPDESTRKKLSESNKGQKRSLESIERGVISRRIKRNKKIVQFDFQGNMLKEFNSCREAGEHIGSSTSYISKCILGIRTSKEFIWKYVPIGVRFPAHGFVSE